MKSKILILGWTALVISYDKLTILINVAVSSRSHVGGVLEITNELVERGHQIHYATASRYHAYAKGYNVTLHELPDIPDELYHGIGEGIHTYVRATRGLEKFIEYSTPAYNYFYQEYTKSFTGITDLIKITKFDLIICDFYSLGCRDAANTLGVPMVIGLQSTVAFGLFDIPYISQNVDGKPITIENMSLFEKLYDFTVTRYNNRKFGRVLRDAFNDARAHFNIPSQYNQLDPLNQNLLLSISFTGFETPFHAPPNLHMVGPVRSSVKKPLTDEVNQFLNSHKRIAYVGFGTYTVMIQEDIEDVTNALKLLIDQDKIDGAIWGSGYNLFNHSTHPDIKFISSAPQKAILNQQNTRLFISHCGIESVFESIEAAVPVLCFPLIADQPVNGAKVEDAGIGRMYDRRQSTPASLTKLASTILEDKADSFHSNLIRLKTIADRRSLHAVSDGANLLEDYAYTAQACRPFQSSGASVPCEVAHLIPASERMSYLKAYLFDVYLVLGLICFTFFLTLTSLMKLIYNLYLSTGVTNRASKMKNQ